MDFALALHQVSWQTVYTIPKGTILVKGRHGHYHEIMAETAKIQGKFGCYSWGTESSIFFIGSFTNYARLSFKSNFQARIHNYLQNHQTKANGRINTNLMVFNNLNSILGEEAIILRYLNFTSLQIGSEIMDFDTFANTADSSLVDSVEQLLICSYRRINQSKWNRT